MEEENTSDFGKGFIYNLVLFAKHYERHSADLKRNDEMAEKSEYWRKGNVDMWFNAAADHLFELEIPESIKEKEAGKILFELQEEALERRLSDTTKGEFDLFWEKFEKCLLLLDKELGIDSVEARWN